MELLGLMIDTSQTSISLTEDHKTIPGNLWDSQDHSAKADKINLSTSVKFQEFLPARIQFRHLQEFQNSQH